MKNAFDLIEQEVARIGTLPNSAEIIAQDAANTLNDRVATAIAYLGRVPQTVKRNVREQCDPIENLVKAGQVICAAIEAELAKRP
jgi:hypothetical protein